MTSTYWEIGRRMVEYEQGGQGRAAYGRRLIERVSADLKRRFGRGFGVANLWQMRKFYLERLLSIENPQARAFYETEALRNGWSVRRLDRQISTMFYERTALSRNKAAMLKKGAETLPEDTVTAEEEIKDPLILGFLGFKDEYSESDLEEALIRHLESFLLELGGDFAFVGRQRALRIGDAWYHTE